MADFYITVGDRLPDLHVTLTDASGAAVDLDGATVLFVMAAVGGAPKVKAAATAVLASAGQYKYVWAAADTNTAGTYRAEFVATIGGLEMSFPSGPDKLTVEVVGEVAKLATP